MTEATAVRTVAGVEVPAPGVYQLDLDHSVVEFVVRHLGLSKVRGRFNQFEGAITIDEEIERSSAQVTIQAASIDTRAPDRDTHLRSDDFLDVENHPTLEFRTTGVRQEDGQWYVDGDLTVAGQTRPVTLEVEFEGTAKDPWGNTRIAFSAETTVNREEFGLTWNQALETGGWLVGRDVKLELSVQGVKQD
ncbi:MAG TPA: YceI family protein [Egibacteraceae bacterium]|nr:YceI family protein [Egibacteraceae bacterium]